MAKIRLQIDKGICVYQETIAAVMPGGMNVLHPVSNGKHVLASYAHRSAAQYTTGVLKFGPNGLLGMQDYDGNIIWYDDLVKKYSTRGRPLVKAAITQHASGETKQFLEQLVNHRESGQITANVEWPLNHIHWFLLANHADKIADILK